MSIIHDALKKTQTKLENKQDKNTSKIYEKLHKPKVHEEKEKTVESESVTIKKKKVWHKKAFVIFGMVFFLAGIVYVVSINFLNPSSHFTPQKAITLPNTSLSTPLPQRTYPKGALVLSGTSMIENKRVAIINDEIYEIGEFVNGKKIISISLVEVALQDKNKVITLSVKRRKQ